MTLKDSIDPDRHSNEARLSPNIHAEGDFPGVVLLVSAEDVKCHRQDIDFTSGDSDKTRPKRCLALANTGLKLEYAESVNELLMSTDDVLEGSSRDFYLLSLAHGLSLKFTARSLDDGTYCIATCVCQTSSCIPRS